MARVLVPAVRANRTRPSKAAIERAARAIRRGDVVAFPTETVYGLGANALSAKAARKIFTIKGRLERKPLLVLIANRKDLPLVARSVPPAAEKLMDAFWPGPLTIIFKKHPRIPSVVSGGKDTVGVRLSSHPVARALVRAAGTPITAPSANLSGKPAHRTARAVARELGTKLGFTFVLDGGRTPIGTPSTIIDVTKKRPSIVRRGAISEKKILKILR